MSLTWDSWWVVSLFHAALCLAAFAILPLVVGQAEHKIMAHMQGRLGPMHAGGFHGWAQLIADGIKFLQKDQIVPATADRKLFSWAPVVGLLPYLLVFAVIPVSVQGSAIGWDVGAVFVVAILNIGIIGVLMAGWSSGNSYSTLGASRAASQLMSYEVPFVLAVASVVMAAGTANLQGIVHAWNPWWLIWQLPALFVFFSAALAEIRRPPFDAPMADGELVFGYMTEYSGLRFALLLLAEYAGIVVISALTAVLFLGGWVGPFAQVDSHFNIAWGALWLLLKTFAVAVVVIWLRVSLPRLRPDQVSRFCWLVLVPVALGQLVLTAVVKVVM